MFDLFFNFPSFFYDSKKLVLEKKVDFNFFTNIQNIVISGMGGSGFSGDFILYLFKDHINLPIIINKNYNLPNFVSDKTLLFLVSYSGDTEETLSNFLQGEQRRSKIVMITSNGEMLNKSKGKYLYFEVPKNIPPRMAFPYLFYPIYFILKNFTNYNFGEEEFFEKIDSIYKDYQKENNLGNVITNRIINKIPIIYTSDSITPVGLRWKQEINENSKYIAYNLSFPELNHNESVFWECKSLKDKLIFIILKDRFDSPQMKKRIDVSIELLKSRDWEVVELTTFGEKNLLNLYSLIPLGDYISIKLAYMDNIDPLPVKIIDDLKKKLKE